MVPMTSSPSATMAKRSSLLLIGGREILTTSTRSFTSGMAADLFCSSLFPLTKSTPGNHFRFAVKRSWPLPTSKGSRLCIVCPDHSLSNTRSFQLFQLNTQLTLKHLNTKVTLTWQLQIIRMKDGATTSTVLCTNWYKNRQTTLNKPNKLTLGIPCYMTSGQISVSLLLPWQQNFDRQGFQKSEDSWFLEKK